MSVIFPVYHLQSCINEDKTHVTVKCRVVFRYNENTPGVNGKFVVSNIGTNTEVILTKVFANKLIEFYKDNDIQTYYQCKSAWFRFENSELFNKFVNEINKNNHNNKKG